MMQSITDDALRHRLVDAELTLIRAGQHVFKEWRSKGRVDKDLEASFECIWELKRKLREEKRMLVEKMRQRTIGGDL